MDKSEQGKKSRAAGMRFELKVRKDLKSKGWIVDKWTNNLALEKYGVPTYMHPAKSNTFNMRSTGFPDFIAFKLIFEGVMVKEYDVIAVESKMNWILSKVEKEKCEWYLENNIFSKILIASKGKQRGEIVYKEFEASKNRSHGLKTSHERGSKK